MTTDIVVVRPIRPADDPAIAAVIRDTLTEFGCTSAGFALHDPEVDAMSAAYPGGPADPAQYDVVEIDGVVVGGAGFGPLAGSDPAAATCELRKMYFRPAARGRGLGRRLLVDLLERMHAAGYRRCYLETAGVMHAAQALYAALGFERLPGPLGATGHGDCDVFFARRLGPR